eukprot:TRINITY_DN1218_c0_g3_i1.p1 TRINITY_DN1218_c0_g3~~TRINITY_DN1218_c0_g3_i1.p1  ORF type:complete len:443 (+),score=127.07 TRINITY_DN1218_c0_g3_i1:55-1329(+)
MRSSLMILASAAAAMASEELRAYTFCEMGVTSTTAGVAGTTFEVTKALEACVDVTSSNCTRDITLAKDVFAGLVRLSPKVVGYCSGHSHDCQSDVAHANAAITAASGPMGDLSTACSSNAGECRLKLLTINGDMATAALRLHTAATDCHTNKTISLKGSKICEYEVDAVTAGIATTTEELAKSIKACADITSANCSSGVATASQMLTATRTAAAKGVTVCGKSTPCGEDVESINGTLAKAQVPLAAAVTACKAGGSSSVCHVKLAAANAEVATAGLAAAKAHTDCKANATSLAAKSDVCKYEIALVSAGVAAAAEEVGKAVKICANITDPACAEDVDNSKSIVDGLVPVVNRMVSGCGSANATCAADVNAVKSSLDKAQTPIGNAADSCKAGGSAATCKIDLAGTSADLATAALDLSKAEKDCM